MDEDHGRPRSPTVLERIVGLECGLVRVAADFERFMAQSGADRARMRQTLHTAANHVQTLVTQIDRLEQREAARAAASRRRWRYVSAFIQGVFALLGASAALAAIYEFFKPAPHP